MGADLSRIRSNPLLDFAGVELKQGGVLLDADFNEFVAVVDRRLRAAASDILGRSTVSSTTPSAFKITAVAGALSIGKGRLYVDGLLAENHGAESTDTEKKIFDSLLAEPTFADPGGYAAQPYLPNAPVLPTTGTHLVYLDVWQRELTHLERPELVETAVGVETSSRLQSVWQVRVLGDDAGGATCASPDEDVAGWPSLTAASSGRLTTGTFDVPPSSDPCELPPTGGYRGLENQTYRVEIQDPGLPGGTATFKWARDNACVGSRVASMVSATELELQTLGRDDVLRFNTGDWVEIIDDVREFSQRCGEIRKITVNEAAHRITFSPALPSEMLPAAFPNSDFPQTRNLRARRWDQKHQVLRAGPGGATLPFQDLDAVGSTGVINVPAAGTSLLLDNGVTVSFSSAGAKGFRAGDYWVFAARTADASVEVLANEPPRGIHHHYVRLGIWDVAAEVVTDCRHPWPPRGEGHDCSCTECVTPESHNSSELTIQDAVDRLRDTGGTICLGIGTYDISTTLKLDGARSLRIRGQGWGTLLVGSQPGGIIDIASSNGVALENLTVIGSTSKSGSIISARNVVDLRADHINVLGLAVGDATSVGIGLAGYILGVSISDCAIVAERGIAATTSGDRNYVLTGEFHAAHNVFFCTQRAMSFDGTSLHYGNTRIDENLMLGGSQAAIVATGAVLPGSSMGVADNVIYTTGDGIHAGVDGLAIERNEITGSGSRSGHGIVLEEGLDPVALDHARITGNRLLSLRGNGITMNHRVETAIISENMIDGMGEGAFVMGEGGAVGHLRFAGNQCVNLGKMVDNAKTAFAAVQLIRVERGDVLDNVIANVARQAISSPGIDALRTAAIGQLRVAGNRFYGIGPDRISAPVAAAHLLPPFDRVTFDDNSVERIADANQKLSVVEWRAINIAPEPLGVVIHFAAASYFATAAAAYLLTANRAIAFPVHRSAVSIRGNQLRGHLTGVPLNQCASVDSCLFGDNHCEVLVKGGNEPLLGLLAARTLNVSNNRLIGLGDLQTLHLRPQVEQAIVMGNTSTGGILVQSGAPVPPDMSLTNIFGI
jgi:hypothetical protein